MKKHHKPKKISLGNIISAAIFSVILISLIVFTFLYDPNSQIKGSFFEDVARSVKWK